MNRCARKHHVLVACIFMSVLLFIMLKKYSNAMHRTSQKHPETQWTSELYKCMKSELDEQQKKFTCKARNQQLIKSHYDSKVNITWNNETLSLDGNTEKWWSHLQWPYKYLNPSFESPEDLMKKLIDDGFSSQTKLEKNKKGCRSCAVVGNSQILRMSCYGKLIDAHDFVIRFNEAEVRGYEAQVGNRTTHLIAYPESCPETVDKGVLLIFLALKKADLKWLESASHSGPFHLLSYQSSFDKISVDKSKVNIIHPEFIRYVNTNWSGGQSSYPSAGMLGTVLGIHICDTVTLFGFGANKNGMWQHYYEVLKPSDTKFVVDTHNRDHEKEMLLELEKSRAIFRYY